MYVRPLRIPERVRVERLPAGESDHLPIVASLATTPVD